MQNVQSRLQGNAAGTVILTIIGMLAGLGCGLIWSLLGPEDPFRRMEQIVSGGFFGMVLALGLALLLVARERGGFRSVRKTMIFIAAAAVVIWAIMTRARVFIR